MKAQRLDEVVALAEEALAARKSATTLVPPAAAAREAAGLWGLIGLARQGLDDLDGARFALEEAIALAPGGERSVWERHLVALALAVGRRSIERAATGPAADRVASLESAVEWLERGLAIAPHDAELREAAELAARALQAAGGSDGAGGLGVPVENLLRPTVGADAPGLEPDGPRAGVEDRLGGVRDHQQRRPRRAQRP